jgi:hypothetical protein
MEDAVQNPSTRHEFHQELNNIDTSLMSGFQQWSDLELILINWSSDQKFTHQFKERKGIVDLVAKDQIHFIEMEIFRPSNFRYVRSLTMALLERKISQQVITELPSSDIRALDNARDCPVREWNLRAITTKIPQP